jgi:hypothetical protein
MPKNEDSSKRNRCIWHFSDLQARQTMSHVEDKADCLVARMNFRVWT